MFVDSKMFWHLDLPFFMAKVVRGEVEVGLRRDLDRRPDFLRCNGTLREKPEPDALKDRRLPLKFRVGIRSEISLRINKGL